MAAKQGVTLDQYLKSKGPLPAVQVARLACQLAQQMAKESESAPGHRAPVLHPGRIAVGKGGSVEVLPADDEDLALPVAAGFPAYASPEEIRGESGDFRSSLYSLGCTIYELLTGAPPFDGPSAKEILRAHIKDPVPDPRHLAVDVDDAFAETVRELLYKDPELRVQSAAELVRRLRQSTGAEERAAAPQGPQRPQRPQTPQRPQRAPRAAATGAGRGRQVARAARHGAGGPSPRRGVARAGLHEEPVRGRSGGRRGPGGGGGRAAAGRLGRKASGAARSRMPEDDFMDYDEEERVLPRTKKAYPFTYCGLGLGVLVSLAYLVVGIRETQELPQREAEMKEEVARENLKRRKEDFRKLMARHKTEMEKLVKQARNIAGGSMGTGMKLAAIENLMLNVDIGEYSVPSIPGAVRIAEECAKMAQMRRAESGYATGGATGEGGDDGFEAHKAGVERLWAADRWGDALAKLREGEMEFRSHSKEIDEMYFEREDKLYKRWEEDKKRALNLAGEGKYSEAVAIFSKASTYGTYEMKQESEKLIAELNTRSVARADEGVEEEPEEEEVIDPFENLEDAFKKETGKKGGGEGGGSKDGEADEGL
jgi:hypothetical protein